ncbi:hypothetical protein [Lysobacter capsici]|uniref:hypothetical protein n=1 Tax=Lysobacter capsici TaxID=435897 RepID=UPI001C008699|nr:hypothetical protein [Lysobacter capsici]QWF15082.1 hypothetical protein KME82_14865 [Lysobacter capsici]
MQSKIKAITCAALALLVVTAPLASAQDAKSMESGLIDALRFDAKRHERVAPSGPALQAYIRAGYLDARPGARADYTDYRLMKKPATLMGHTLVVIEEEYMTAYVGCCVSEGVGVTVRLNGAADTLKAFAKDNACTYSELDDPGAELKGFDIANDLPKGKYASLSCRERDSQR